MIKTILYLTLILLFFPCIVSAQVVNGFFDTSIDGWSPYTESGGFIEWDDEFGIGETGFALIASSASGGQGEVTSTFSQYVDVTGYSSIGFYAKTQITYGSSQGGDIYCELGSEFVDIGFTVQEWDYIELDVVGTGVQELKYTVYRYSPAGYGGAWMRLDNVEMTESPTYTLSGYVTSDANPVNLVDIVLSKSAGNTTTNEIGYYSIPNISADTYTISATRVGYTDYTDSVTISDNTEKNITMTYATPTLLSLSVLDAGDNSLLLGWKESIGADGVYVYVDSQTNLVATVETPYTNIKMYDLTNLEPGTSYNIWCKPYKDDMQGSMYYVSGTTTGGGGGGGGGGAVEVLPPYEDIQPEIPEYPETYDMTNITSSDLITLAATNPEVIYEALSNITIKSPLSDKPGDNLLYFYLLILSICGTLVSSKKEGWDVVTIISFVVVVISLIKLGWI